MIRLVLLMLACCAIQADEAKAMEFGSFTLVVPGKFDTVTVGKDDDGHAALTLASENGLAIHLLEIQLEEGQTAEAAVDAVAAEALKEIKDKGVTKTEKAMTAGALKGKSVTIAWRDADEGDVLTLLGVFSDGSHCLHLELNASQKTFTKEKARIERLLQSVTLKP